MLRLMLLASTVAATDACMPETRGTNPAKERP